MNEVMNGCIPLWMALAGLVIVGGFAWLKGWADGKGLGHGNRS